MAWPAPRCWCCWDISSRDALAGVDKGTDVYLFLVGMMLLAEIARQEGLFDWLAAARCACAGSARRLFLLVYRGRHGGHDILVERCHGGGADARRRRGGKTAKARSRFPICSICAFIANAASFVLPISNPANLVVYGSHMPPLLRWLPAVSYCRR